MTGVFLIIILAVVWYVAGIFHSFALMLYVAVNLLLIAGMYILTRIYKRNVAFDFDVNLAEELKNSGCQLRINVSNKTGIPITKIRLDVVVSYCDKKGKEYKKYRKNVKLYGGCKGRKDNMDLSVSLPYCGMADVKIVKAKVYDYTGLFYCTIKPLSIMNILIFPEVESSIYEGAFSQYESNNNIELYINRKGSSHDDIRQIREYQTGDSYRHIHWNLSSRTGDLLIKEFCGQVDREILVLLDTLPDDINNIERMSSFYDKTAMLVMGFIQDDTKVSVLWNDLNSGALCKQTVSDYDDLKNVYYILYRLHYNCRNNDTDISREYSLGEYIDKNIIKIDTSSDVTELLGENVYGEHAFSILVGRINVRQAHSDTYNGNPYIAFAGIMTGLLSVILFVDELDAVSFTVVGVLLFSGIYAYILSYAHYNKRKFLPFVIVGEVAVTAILSVFNIQRISEQSVSIIQALVDGRANTQNVTYVVFVSSVVLIYIIYLLEVIFKNRVILTLVTVVMLAASPILRLEVSLFHIFVIVMHQVIVGVSYAVLGRRKKMLYTTRSGKLIHKKSIIYCIAATVIIFFAADIITNIFSEYMYGSISGIEQTIYKTSKRISGKGSDVKINGEISSGNNYQSGITQMTVTVSKMPTEDLYLYGFRGGEYKGGSWDSTDDDTICKNIDRTEFKKETISQPV